MQRNFSTIFVLYTAQHNEWERKSTNHTRYYTSAAIFQQKKKTNKLLIIVCSLPYLQTIHHIQSCKIVDWFHHPTIVADHFECGASHIVFRLWSTIENKFSNIFQISSECFVFTCALCNMNCCNSCWCVAVITYVDVIMRQTVIQRLPQAISKRWCFSVLFSFFFKFSVYICDECADIQFIVIKKILNNFTEAEDYIDLLETEGVNKPVDVDADSCTIQLPDWYDANLFKRYVSICLSTAHSIFKLHLKIACLHLSDIHDTQSVTAVYILICTPSTQSITLNV